MIERLLRWWTRWRIYRLRMRIARKMHWERSKFHAQVRERINEMKRKRGGGE